MRRLLLLPLFLAGFAVPAASAQEAAPVHLVVIDRLGPAVGRAAITEVAQAFMTAFPDMQVFLDELRLEDEGVVYHWTLTGTNTGPGGTGRAVRISGCEVWQMGAGGLIATSRGRFDAEEYRRQLETGN